MIHKPMPIDFRLVIASLAILVLGLAACFITNDIKRNEYEDQQYEAAVLMQEAEAFLKADILSRGIEMEAEDLNNTALIGPEFTELTTTPGAVDAKRTALNPNFAAAMIRYYCQAGLKEGDEIAVGTSGSFPGLAIAVVTSAKVMGLKAKVIASCGSSMHGATRPEYTIFDMLLGLNENGFSDFELLAVSGGGPNDQGGGVLEGILFEGTAELSQELCRKAALRSKAELISFDKLSDSIQRRLELYGDNIKLFINVGGAAPNEGTSSYTLSFPQGLVLTPPTIPEVENRGLNYEFAAKGLPVLNLLNVKLLASQNGIAYDSVPLQSPGKGQVYTTSSYSKPLMVLTIALSLSCLAIGLVIRRKKDK
ncbi:MAG: poly-gamma-glutamate system protein [Sphaerochaetaceae bacterium]|jgi:poly-gamma-glutamate system protein|nr:poly-gamma-glutamate system protein [Sphaerochaetaceae bacterium]